MFSLGRRYTSRQCFPAREALQLQYESRVTELSFRGYDVVAVSAYIASERDLTPPPVCVSSAEGMNFANAERDVWVDEDIR